MTTGPPRGIWLNLSGGGFRAAIYHYGFIKRLCEEGLAHQVRGLSATSGGAMVAAYWQLEMSLAEGDTNEALKKFESTLLSTFERGLLAPVLMTNLALILEVLSLAWLLAWLLEWLKITGATAIFAVLMMACGLVLHLMADVSTRFELERRKAYVIKHGRAGPLASLLTTREPTSLRAMQRAARFRPSIMRQLTLVARLYGTHRLRDLKDGNLILNCVDVVGGGQIALSHRVAADPNDDDGARYLWAWAQSKARTASAVYNCGSTLIAEAVAASTAIPPVFRPVRLKVMKGEEAVNLYCIDGGVVDNAAFKAVRGLVRVSNRLKNRGIYAFEDLFERIVTVDASRPDLPLSVPFGRAPGRRHALRRYVAIAQGGQSADLIASIKSIGKGGIPCELFGLHVGPTVDEIEEIWEERLCRAAKTRTSLDACTPAEICALAYIGYTQAGYLNGPPRTGFPDTPKDLAAFSEELGYRCDQVDWRTLDEGLHRPQFSIRRSYRALRGRQARST